MLERADTDRLIIMISLLLPKRVLTLFAITSVANFTLFGVDLRFFYCLRLRLSKYCPASTLLHSEPHQCWQIYAFLFSEAANLP